MVEVTVVVPTRDRPALLARTLASVLAQQDVDLDVVVVDDGSDPPLRLEGLPVRVIRLQRPVGRSAARNRGVEEAGGPWVAFCDDDDLWAPDKVSAQLAAAHRGAARWLYSGEVLIDAHDELVWGFPPPSPERALEDLHAHNPLSAGASNVLVDRALFLEVGGFDPGLDDAEDWDLWLRLAQLARPDWVPRPLVAYRMHFGVRRTSLETIAHAREVVARRHGLALDPTDGARRAAWAAMQAGDRTGAARYYARAVAAGDLRSLGRLALALAHPSVGTPAMYRWLPDPDPAWCTEAAAWIARL